ncbi:restriction endonuclease subunit S [Facklamia languida]
MIDTELLKEKVLDLAMRGKLVEQDPTDGHARDLLREIQAEREQLVKDKKIKKSKPLPPISEEEIPYEIPESWEWVRLEELRDLIPNSIADGPFGSNLKSSHYTLKNEVRIIQLSNVSKEGWRDENKKYTTFEHLETIKRSKVEAGNIVITKMMPAGVAMVVPDIEEKYVLSSDVIKFVPYERINSSFLAYFINGPFFQDQVKSELQGSTRKRTSIKKIKKYIVPLPSLGEQERIINQINHLFKLIDHLADQQDKFNYYKKLVQDKALELAMQGKLVPQLPEEGTATSLLEEVEAERQRLIDEKKIKKTKPLPEISEEEIPYEIPESWEWVRLGSIGVVTSGGTPNTSVEDYWKDAHIPWITPAAMSDNNKMYFDELSNMRYINELGYQNSSAKLIKKKSIIYSSRAPIGYINIVPFDFTTNQGCKSLSTFQQVNVEYVYYSIMSRKEEIIRSGSGSTFKEISGTKFSNITIPLPPVKEQERIVNKLDEIDQALFSEH